MNAAQEVAFEEGTGGFFTAFQMSWTIQAIGVTVVFLFVAWICIRAYNDYGTGAISAKDMIILWFRSTFVMMLLLYLLAN